MTSMATVQHGHDREADELKSVARYQRVAALGDAGRRIALRDVIHEEYSGDPETTRQMTADRLHAWLTLARSDLEAARTLGATYDAVFEGLPAELAMRRAMAVQTAVASEFDDQERTLLLDIIPGMVRHVPPKTGAVATKPSTRADTTGVKQRRFPRLFHRSD